MLSFSMGFCLVSNNISFGIAGVVTNFTFEIFFSLVYMHCCFMMVEIKDFLKRN